MIKLARSTAKTLARTAAAGALTLGLLTLPAASPAAPQSQDPNQPKVGYWQYNYHVSIIPAGNDMKCLNREDVKNFFSNLCTRHFTCVYTTNETRDGKVKLVGTWTDHKNRVTKVNADGVYDPASFHLNAHVNLGALLGIGANGTIDGKFIADTCPAGSENPKKKG
jgi:hypothetical protein